MLELWVAATGKNLVRNFHKVGSLFAVFDVDEYCGEEMSKTYNVVAVRDFENLPEDSCEMN